MLASRDISQVQATPRQALTRRRTVRPLDTGEGGKAFGSITAKDIGDRLRAESGQDIDRHRIALERPIKSTGEFTVDVRLHSDVHAALKVIVTAKNPPPAPTEDDHED